VGAAAAVIMMKERRLVEAFTLAAATSPERAVPLETLGVEHAGLALRRLQKRAVIREGASGRFYLDVLSWEALRRTRRRLAFILITIVLLVLIVALLSSRGAGAVR